MPANTQTPMTAGLEGKQAPSEIALIRRVARAIYELSDDEPLSSQVWESAIRAIVAVSNPTDVSQQEKFAALAPDAPLPWNIHPRKEWLIVDARGGDVCNVDGSDPDFANIVAMILVAVNTCGGYRATLSKATSP